jgi:hypothetical protein
MPLIQASTGKPLTVGDEVMTLRGEVVEIALLLPNEGIRGKVHVRGYSEQPWLRSVSPPAIGAYFAAAAAATTNQQRKGNRV